MSNRNKKLYDFFMMMVIGFIIGMVIADAFVFINCEGSYQIMNIFGGEYRCEPIPK